MVSKNTINSFIFILCLMFTSIGQATLIYRCDTLLGTTWTGKLFDANTGQLLGNIAVTINGLIDDRFYGGSYKITGTGFIRGSCIEYIEVVHSVSFNFVVKGISFYMWSNYPSEAYMHITNDDDLDGYLIKS